jgi:hypothetical protein
MGTFGIRLVIVRSDSDKREEAEKAEESLNTHPPTCKDIFVENSSCNLVCGISSASIWSEYDDWHAIFRSRTVECICCFQDIENKDGHNTCHTTFVASSITN